MNKEDYVHLHTLLAKLRYELEMELLEVNDNYINELKKQIEAINTVMEIFIVDSEV